MKLKSLFFTYLFMLFIVSVEAQEMLDTTQVWRIVTHDGNEFVGASQKINWGQIMVTVEEANVCILMLGTRIVCPKISFDYELVYRFSSKWILFWPFPSLVL